MAFQSALLRSSTTQCTARASPAALRSRRIVGGPVPRRGTAAPSPVVAFAAIEKVNGEQLEVAIAERDTLLIVDFYATWCGPCVMLAEELKKVASELDGKVKIVKVDVDENPELSSMLKIQGLPTIVFIPKENGRPALRTEGLLPATQIIDIINQLGSAGAAAPQPAADVDVEVEAA